MQVHLIRHTTPVIEKGTCYGQSDIAIEENLFDKEFETIRSKIPSIFDQVYSSPLQRCTKLAQKLSPEIQIDARLKEMDFGDWELHKWDNIGKEPLNSWMNDYVSQTVPGGESFLQLYERSANFLDDLLRKEHKKVAIITHAGNIRSILSWTLGLPLKNTFRIALNYGTVVKLNLQRNKELNQMIFLF